MHPRKKKGFVLSIILFWGADKENVTKKNKWKFKGRQVPRCSGPRMSFSMYVVGYSECVYVDDLCSILFILLGHKSKMFASVFKTLEEGIFPFFFFWG